MAGVVGALGIEVQMAKNVGGGRIRRNGGATGIHLWLEVRASPVWGRDDRGNQGRQRRPRGGICCEGSESVGEGGG